MTDTAIVKKEEKGMVEFVPFGASNPIRLSAAMVSAFIAVPTKSGKLPTERDCVRFIMLCQGKRANPFEGDCFLIGYDNQDGKANFSLVCGVELFLKRAEQSPDYDGYEAGVIIKRGDNIEERQGAMVYDGEIILGAWCKVHRKNRALPTYKSVRFSTYDTARSRWAKDPGGMIVKVAVSQAHREAYPTALGGLYSQEEMQRVAETGQGSFEMQDPIAMPIALPQPTSTVAAPVSQATPPPARKGDPSPEAWTGGGARPREAEEGEESITGLVEEIKEKSGETNGKPWTIYSVKVGGEWHTSFDPKSADDAHMARDNGMSVKIWWKASGKFRNIVSLHLLDPQGAMEE